MRGTADYGVGRVGEQGMGETGSAEGDFQKRRRGQVLRPPLKLVRTLWRSGRTGESDSQLVAVKFGIDRIEAFTPDFESLEVGLAGHLNRMLRFQ